MQDTQKRISELTKKLKLAIDADYYGDKTVAYCRAKEVVNTANYMIRGLARDPEWIWAYPSLSGILSTAEHIIY